jgi:hypothetical protein
VNTEVKTVGKLPQAEEHLSHQELEEPRRTCYRASEPAQPYDVVTVDVWSLDKERKPFCSFKPPGLWPRAIALVLSDMANKMVKPSDTQVPPYSKQVSEPHRTPPA